MLGRLSCLNLANCLYTGWHLFAPLFQQWFSILQSSHYELRSFPRTPTCSQSSRRILSLRLDSKKKRHQSYNRAGIAGNRTTTTTKYKRSSIDLAISRKVTPALNNGHPKRKSEQAIARMGVLVMVATSRVSMYWMRSDEGH